MINTAEGCFMFWYKGIFSAVILAANTLIEVILWIKNENKNRSEAAKTNLTTRANLKRCKIKMGPTTQ